MSQLPFDSSGEFGCAAQPPVLPRNLARKHLETYPQPRSTEWLVSNQLVYRASSVPCLQPKPRGQIVSLHSRCQRGNLNSPSIGNKWKHTVWIMLTVQTTPKSLKSEREPASKLSIKIIDCWVMGLVLKTTCKEKPLNDFSANRADHPAIRQAEASVFPSSASWKADSLS